MPSRSLIIALSLALAGCPDGSGAIEADGGETPGDALDDEAGSGDRPGGGGDRGAPDGDDPGDERPVPTGALPCVVDRVMVERCHGCHGERLRFGAPMPLVTLGDFHAASPTQPDRVVFDLVSERVLDDARPMPPAPAERVDPTGTAVVSAWAYAGAPAGEACGEDDGGNDGEGDPGSGGGEGEGEGEGEGIDDGPDEPAPQRPTVVPYDECEYLVELRAHQVSAPGDDTPYEVPMDNNHYQCFEFKVPWDTPVHGLAFSPLVDDDRVLHHWLLYGQNGGARDGRSRGCGGQHNDANLLAGWAPGGEPWILPAGVGLQLPQGDDGFLVLEVHYNNAAGHVDARDRSGVEVCATRQPRAEEAAVHWLGSELIFLLGDGDQEVTGRCNPRSDQPIHLLSIWPHMHRRGRHMKLVVHREGGGSDVLHDDPFDFNNQVGYWTPTTVLPGDSIETTCTFENSGGVTIFGPNTENEMCYNFVVAYPAGALSNGRGLAGDTNFCLF